MRIPKDGGVKNEGAAPRNAYSAANDRFRLSKNLNRWDIVGLNESNRQ